MRLWLWLGLTLTLLVNMIIQHNRRIVTHYKYAHNALYMDALSKVFAILSSNTVQIQFLMIISNSVYFVKEK